MKCLASSSEKAMAPHSSTLAWKIPWMEEPGRLQSMGLWRVRHDWATSFSLFIFMHWRRKWQPTSVFLLGESQGRGSLVGCPLWVAQSQTRLKWLSSSSSSSSSFKLPYGHKLAASAPTITFQAERRKVKKKCCYPAEPVYLREFSQMLPAKLSAYVWGHYVLLDKIGRVDIR